MFGVSFLELALVAVVALMVVGPKKLPGLMRTLGEWVGKIRKLTTEMRAQTGIDDILRQEGIDGVHELRSLLRGEIHAAKGRQQHEYLEQEGDDIDLSAEYPTEGADAYGALSEDLLAVPADSSPGALEASSGLVDVSSGESISGEKDLN